MHEKVIVRIRCVHSDWRTNIACLPVMTMTTLVAVAEHIREFGEVTQLVENIHGSCDDNIEEWIVSWTFGILTCYDNMIARCYNTSKDFSIRKHA